MNRKELIENIETYLGIIKNYVIENEESYPACISVDRIRYIECYVESGERDLAGIEMMTGLCFKDSIYEQNIEQFGKELKERDFVINYGRILQSAATVKLYEGNEELRNIEANGYKTIKFDDISEVCVSLVNSKNYTIFVTKEEFTDAVLSIVTHEFMHSISIGFADDSNKNDEVYTNMYAEELFKKVLEERKFYDMYIMCPNNSKYIEEMEAAKEKKEKIRNLYFQGVDK